MLSVVNNDEAGAEGRFGLDEICREGARTMLAAALEAEVDAYLAELGDERDDDGHRVVTRNGHARQRKVQTVAGAVEIEAPRVNDRRVNEETGKKAHFSSSIVPPWCRRSPKVTEVLPLLYLHGLSTGDFAPALERFFGTAAGLSASVITRLTTAWQDEHRAFMTRNLADRDYVYLWADVADLRLAVASLVTGYVPLRTCLETPFTPSCRASRHRWCPGRAVEP
jgi:transposase-like protein